MYQRKSKRVVTIIIGKITYLTPTLCNVALPSAVHLQVWSMVVLIYNNWIIYLPTSAEKDEGILETPVMCSTTRWVGQ